MNENETRRTNHLPLIVPAPLPLTLGLGSAQQSSVMVTDSAAQTRGAQPAQPGQGQRGSGTQARPGSGTTSAAVFWQKLAAQLGTTVARLKAAAVSAGSATIDQGVRAGGRSCRPRRRHGVAAPAEPLCPRERAWAWPTWHASARPGRRRPAGPHHASPGQDSIGRRPLKRRL